MGRTVYLAQRNTDIAIPMVISGKGYGILWDMHSFGILSIRGGELRAWFEAGKNLDYYLISGPDLDKVISGYRFLTDAAPYPLNGLLAIGNRRRDMHLKMRLSQLRESSYAEASP